MKGWEVKLHLHPEAVPKFCKPRPVSFALSEGVNKDLEQLEVLGIIKPIASSEWSAPIIHVVNQEKSITVCGDYKLTINSASVVESHPLPCMGEIFCSYVRWLVLY